jgi:hypothetical protein
MNQTYYCHLDEIQHFTKTIYHLESLTYDMAWLEGSRRAAMEDVVFLE